MLDAAVGLAATHERLEASDQDARFDGLDHIVVRAELEAQHMIDIAVAGGQHEDGGRAGLANFAADRKAVAPGQAHVEHDQIGFLALDPFDAAVAPMLDADPKAVALEIGADEVCQAHVVLDEHDQRMLGGIHGDECRHQYNRFQG